MKLTNVNFLAKANAKINKNEKGIKIVSALLVISITLISAFSITVTKAVNEYKEDYRARTLEVDPWLSELDDNVIESIKNTEHVVDIFPLEGIRNEAFNIVQSSDENLQKMIDQNLFILIVYQQHLLYILKLYLKYRQSSIINFKIHLLLLIYVS